MGEYNDVEKEKILALLEEQQNDQFSNTQKIKEILRMHKSDLYTDQSDNQNIKVRHFASDISHSNAGQGHPFAANDISPNFERAEETNSLEDIDSAGIDGGLTPVKAEKATRPEAASQVISHKFAPVD